MSTEIKDIFFNEVIKHNWLRFTKYNSDSDAVLKGVSHHKKHYSNSQRKFSWKHMLPSKSLIKMITQKIPSRLYHSLRAWQDVLISPQEIFQSTDQFHTRKLDRSAQ